jgi:hypothetical protein
MEDDLKKKKWKTTSTKMKMKDDRNFFFKSRMTTLKETEDNLKIKRKTASKNGRQPQKNKN